MYTDHREEMLKLREELLLVEEERKAGKKVTLLMNWMKS